MNTKNVFFFHGAFGDGTENWFPWLKLELEKNNYEVLVPKFPTPEGQSLENWLNIFRPHIKQINNETIMIGHSIGCAFLLNILEQIETPIKGAYLVAGFISLLNNETVDPINKSFTEKNFNWNKIHQNCNKFFIFNSDNDPYVSIEKGQELSHALKIPLNIVRGGGHFNQQAGYTTFPELRDEILS